MKIFPLRRYGQTVVNHKTDKETQALLSRNQLIYSMGGLYVGSICMLIGAILIICGVAGHTNWTVTVLGLESNLSDAVPGVVLFVVGFLIVGITRYTYKHNNDR